MENQPSRIYIDINPQGKKYLGEKQNYKGIMLKHTCMPSKSPSNEILLLDYKITLKTTIKNNTTVATLNFISTEVPLIMHRMDKINSIIEILYHLLMRPKYIICQPWKVRNSDNTNGERVNMKERDLDERKLKKIGGILVPAGGEYVVARKFG